MTQKPEEGWNRVGRGGGGEKRAGELSAKIINNAVPIDCDRILEEVLRKGIEPPTDEVLLEISRGWNKKVLVASAKRNR